MNRREQIDRRHRRAPFIGAAVLVVVIVASFVGTSPVKRSYVVRGLFENVSPLKPGDDVRTAGVSIGRVRSIERTAGGVEVTMAIEDRGRPIHSDATLTIRTRLLLEGNSFVAVDPGSPGHPELPDDGVIPMARTATSVQLDQVLGVLDLPTRSALHRTIGELEASLQPAPRSAPRPAGADALRGALDELERTLPSMGASAAAASGRRPGDLVRAVRGSAAFAGDLATDPTALRDLVTNSSRVAGALTSRPAALADSIRELAALTRAAPRSLDALDAGLPAATRLARDLQPAMKRAPSSLRAAEDFLDEVVRATRPAELPRLTERLAPAAAPLPRLVRGLTTMANLSRPVTDCVTDNLVPNLQRTVPDGKHSTGDPAWLEILHVFTGLTSFSSAVDGNGGTVRLGVASGDQTFTTISPGFERLLGSLPSNAGVTPPNHYDFGKYPDYRPDVPCKGQKLATLGVEEAAAPTSRMSGRAR